MPRQHVNHHTLVSMRTIVIVSASRVPCPSKLAFAPFRVGTGIALIAERQRQCFVEPPRFRHLAFGIKHLIFAISMPVNGYSILNKESVDFNLAALKAVNVDVLRSCLS